MTLIYNKKEKTGLRRKLRNGQTSSEAILWRYLRKNQVHGFKFRRQYGIGRYVTDFYCRELRLAIEIDGANHFFDDKSTNYDLTRQKYIESLGIKVIRITTYDIYNNRDNAINHIYLLVKELSDNLPPPGLPLIKGGGRVKVIL